ncbi:MAG: hypothetical protein ACRDKI_03625 [Solirubrobacterales bacterium]
MTAEPPLPSIKLIVAYLRIAFDAVAMVVVASAMWVVVPLVWLFVGSMVEAHTGSKVFAVFVMYFGVVLLAAAIVKLLSNLDHAWRDAVERLREEAPKRSPLEPVLVILTAIAMIGCGTWMGIGGGCASAPQVCPL